MTRNTHNRTYDHHGTDVDTSTLVTSGLATSASGTTLHAALGNIEAALPLGIMTTKGDLLVRSATAPARLAAGANGKYLMADSAATNGVTWATASGVTDHGALTGLSDDDHTQYTRKDTLTTKGDLYAHDGSAVVRVGAGANGKYLMADSAAAAGVTWTTVSGGGTALTVEEVDANPSVANVSKIRFTNGTVTDDGGGQVTVTVSGGTGVTDHGALTGLADDDHTQYVQKTTLTTKGDLLVHDGSAVTRIGAGTNGKYLMADSASSAGVTWTTVSGGALSGITVDDEGQVAATSGGVTTLNFVGSGVAVTGSGAVATVTVNGATGFIGARVYKSGNQSLTAAGEAVITYDSESFDTDGFHSTSANTSRFTIPAGMGGKYLVSVNVTVAVGSGAYRYVQFKKNGTIQPPLLEWIGGATYSNAHVLTDTMDLVAGDYVEVMIGTADNVNLTASIFSLIKLDSGKVGQGIGASVVKSALQTLTTAVEAAVQWDGTDLFDTNGFHDPSSNNTRLTIPTGMGGKYLVTTSVDFAAHATGKRWIHFRKNGSTDLGNYASQIDLSASNTYLTASAVFDLAAGDYVEIMAYQTSGGNLDIEAGSAWAQIMRLDSGSSPTAIGYQPIAVQPGVASSDTFATVSSIAANGGAVVFPVGVFAPMQLQLAQFRNTDTSSARSWEWGLYVDTGSSTLTRVAGAYGSESFTASTASIRQAAASGAPVLLSPGQYWLCIRNTHATNTLGMGYTAAGSSGAVGSGPAVVASSIISALGETLDATQFDTPFARQYGVAILGRVWGQSSALYE